MQEGGEQAGPQEAFALDAIGYYPEQHGLGYGPSFYLGVYLISFWQLQVASVVSGGLHF